MEHPKKGSALLAAILLSAIFLAAVAALLTVAHNEYRGSLKSYYNTAAFSLAEAGIDRAASFIAGGFPSASITTVTAWPARTTATAQGWYKITGTDAYRGYFHDSLEKGRTGEYYVICTPTAGTSKYAVYSLGIVASGTGKIAIHAERAIKVVLAQKPGSGAGQGYALAAITSITAGQATTWPFKEGDSTGFVRIGSFDSWKNKQVDPDTKQKIFDEPDWYTEMKSTNPNLAQGESTGTNFGDKALVGVKTGILHLNNTILYGTAAAATGASIATTAHYSADGQNVVDGTNGTTIVNLAIAATNKFAYRGLNADAQSKQMSAYLIGVDDSEGDLAKNSRLVKNYAIPDSVFEVPTLPADFANTKITATQDQNAKELTLAGGNYECPQSMGSLQKITVRGKAVLHVTGSINSNSPLVLDFADENSSLRIVADSTVNLKLAPNSSYRAQQFEIGLTTSAGLTINLDNSTTGFTGVIKAPLSTVQFSGNSSRDDSVAGQKKRQQMRGQIIANSINLPGSCNLDVLYDVQIGGGDDDGSTLSLASWKQILPSEFTKAAAL
ncbi:MAG TPA: hypothetical protein PK322_12770 [Opitutaceae bacterium]|nr:hypothetical protein [Opitutaceae bacterium]